MSINWQEPTKTHGVRWQGFLMSDVRGDKSNRRSAKCSYCQVHFGDGKPSVLYNHVKVHCTAISPEKKAAYLQMVHDAPSNVGEGQTQKESKPSTSSKPRVTNKRPRGESQRSNRSRAVTQDKTESLHELLLASIITSDTSLYILNDEHFQKYQRELAHSPYKPPTLAHVIDVVIPVMHAKHEIEVLNKLQNQTHLTLSLDSWKDPYGNITYGVVVQRASNQLRQLLDILDFSSTTHTSQNIFNAVKQTFTQKGLNWDQLSAIVSDSPTLMLELWNLITIEFPHISTLNCGLHAFNLMAKEILSHPLIQSVVMANQALIEFFTTSAYWSEFLGNWARSNKITCDLGSVCQSRWYSMTKLCLSVQEHEQGLKNALALQLNPTSDTPTIPEQLRLIITDVHHFTANQTILKFISPLIDSMTRLQSLSTNVGDIWPELVSLHQAFARTDLMYSPLDPFKYFCQSVLQKRSQSFVSQEIYLAGLFLSPAHRQIAVSRKYNLDYLVRILLTLAKAWRFTRDEAVSLKVQAQAYHADEPCFEVASSLHPPTYWSSLPETPETSALRKLAIAIFELAPHATGVESLYTVKVIVSSSEQPRLSPNTLKMLSHLKYDLQQASPQPTPNTIPTGFETIAQLIKFEEGAFDSEYDATESFGIETVPIDTLFDLDRFIHVQIPEPQQDIPVPHVYSESWDIDDVL